MESSSPLSIVMSLPHFTPIILRLDCNNYNFWKAQVLSTVRAHGFEGFLFGTVSAPPKYSSPSTSDGSDLCLNPDYVSWMRKDQYLLSWMLSSIRESMLGHVNRCSTAAEVWFVFDKLFQSQSKARALQLRFMLQTLKKGDLSVDAYILKMKSLADDLNSAGHIIGDDELVLYILGGLGTDYEYVVVNLTTRVESTHEMRLQSQVTTQFSSSALQASTASHDSVLGSHPSANAAYGFSQNYQRGAGRFIRGCGRGGRNGPFRNNNNKPKCQLCWKTGHVALKCYKRFDVNFTGPDYASSGSGNDSPQAHVSVSGSSSSVDPNWYFDSGATAHVTAEMDNLSLKSVYQGSDKLSHIALGLDEEIVDDDEEDDNYGKDGSTFDSNI
ncbi:hypothetical protein DH2020_016105 [Rehmannia glutinosa]|uniref:Retrotransposon Copia-like N-terminal domain-containing protein n=1 Tax=Rehmannia glutinosa TaxID=99300 RepID=A0ABR0WW51_REHGL